VSIRWAEWGDEAFGRARAAGRPILLSLGARWCHACHRMDEETWEHPGVVAAVEVATVPVRVDADARPDVYGCYHLGGLPTTALLTADGGFVRGGTFLAPPQFFAFLEAALAGWRAGRVPARRPPASRPAPGDLVEAVIRKLRGRVDAEHGGFGSAPKQPETHALRLLLGSWRASRDATVERIVRGALDAILEHLADPRDGGFFRYAAAADWSSPHTEKVAVDQALIARLLLEAGAALAEPRYLEAARETLAHARRRLADHEGRVFASVAADPDYYAGARGPAEPPPVDRRRFADASAAILSAAWLAFALTGDPAGFHPECRAAAPDGRVPHRLDRREGVAGLLRDQALALDAALIEYRVSGDAALLEWAERVAAWTIRHLWDERRGAFVAVPERAGDGVMLPQMFPLLANGEMALGLADLAAHTGRDEHRRHAERLVKALSAEASGSPAGASVALGAQRLAGTVAEADLDGEAADPRVRELACVVLAAFGPAAVIRWRGGATRGVTLCVNDLRLPATESPRDLCQSLMGLGLAPGGILAFGRWLR
jgi:uncharacterized protein